MKFWALVSCFRSQKELLESVLSLPEWNYYYEQYLNYPDLVEKQKRDILDMVLPDDLCRSVLVKCEWKYVVNGLELARIATKDIPQRHDTLSAIDVYNKYGGDCLEDVEEFGVYRIKS